MAYTSADDTTRYTMSNTACTCARRRSREAVPQARHVLRRERRLGFWSADSRTIYFNEGIRATQQLMALDVESGNVRQVTSEQARPRRRSRRRQRRAADHVLGSEDASHALHGGRCRERRYPRIVAAAHGPESASEAASPSARRKRSPGSRRTGRMVGGVLVQVPSATSRASATR